MQRTITIATAVLMAFAGCLTGDGPAGENPPELTDEPLSVALEDSQGEGVISLPSIALDMNKRQIVLESQVCLRNGMLELLVCKGGTKEHESILKTSASPSDLHAALLALGLSPGVPARWVMLDDEQGKLIPPKGGELTVHLRWRDENGQDKSCRADRWLWQAQEDAPAELDRWVFVGSDILPDGAYWADGSGDVLSVSNFSSSVIDVPFTSSNDDTQLIYVTNTDAIPEIGTKVEVIIAPVEGAENADYARASVFIDKDGEVYADGEHVKLENLDEWAMDYVSAHKKGQVVIRTAPLALSHRVRQVWEELRIGGVYTIHEMRMNMEGQLLPRTEQQMQDALEQLNEDLVNSSQFYRDPGERAEELLEQIERERQELQRLDALWQEYAEGVEQALADHEAAPTDTPQDSMEGGQAQ